MSPWLINSGVASHMTGFREFYQYCIHWSYFFTLSNGSKTKTYYEGSIFLNSTLLLTHVLYVSNLKCNLIHHNCNINTTLLMLEFLTVWLWYRTVLQRWRLEWVDFNNGVYYFSTAQASHVYNSSFDLINRHLGHPSYFVMPNSTNHKMCPY